eukprot:SAG31_NODE_1655_length_7621_cov_3.211912_6_plen_297_part_00
MGENVAKQRLRARKSRIDSDSTAFRGGAAAVLLHSALRIFANSKPSLRRSAVFANRPLQQDWNVAVTGICNAKTPKINAIVAGLKRPSTESLKVLLGDSHSLVAAVRRWTQEYDAKNSSVDGLGSLNEFTNALSDSELALRPPSQIVSKNSEIDLDEWVAALPFSTTMLEENNIVEDRSKMRPFSPDSASTAHARGVKVGLYFLRQGSGPGDAPMRAWKPVWSGFCDSLMGQSGDRSEKGSSPAPSSSLWDQLVKWHNAVRQKHRATILHRYNANLKAAKLPPLLTLPSSDLFLSP